MSSQQPTLYEKSPSSAEMGKDEPQNMPPLRTTSRRNRPFTILAAFALAIYLSFSLWSSPVFSRLTTSTPKEIPQTRSQNAEQALLKIDEFKVPLEAHIMSKCPDAKSCLKSLLLPTMSRIAPKVNFTLSYIGTPTTNDGVECLHGAPECMGNILELCAARLYPSPINYLGFTMCLSENYWDIPERYLVEGCALEHGIDFGRLNDCASEDDGAVGMEMLRDSVGRSSDAGVTKSCTVRLNNEIYCIRDGGEWKDCPNGPEVNDLVIAIEKLYRGNN